MDSVVQDQRWMLKVRLVTRQDLGSRGQLRDSSQLINSKFEITSWGFECIVSAHPYTVLYAKVNCKLAAIGIETIAT